MPLKVVNTRYQNGNTNEGNIAAPNILKSKKSVQYTLNDSQRYLVVLYCFAP